MKIRTPNELQDRIDNEMAWRKKELSSIKSNIYTAKNFAKSTALRAGMALLYAHWEGAIKNIATYYLCYISYQKLPYSILKSNFLALAVKNEIESFNETKKATLHNEIVDTIFKKVNESSEIPYQTIIKTGSNLNSGILKEIMATIGLSIAEYEIEFHLIDEVLLNSRNKIAHGEQLEALSLDEERFFEIHDKIKGLIELFSIQISNAACLGSYKIQ